QKTISEGRGRAAEHVAEFAGLVQRLGRLVQTEADRFMNLNALSSQVAARGGDHYDNIIVSIAAESGETPNLNVFAFSNSTPFSAPRHQRVVLCGFVIGSAEQFSHCQKLSLQMSLRYCAACHAQGSQV